MGPIEWICGVLADLFSSEKEHQKDNQYRREKNQPVRSHHQKLMTKEDNQYLIEEAIRLRNELDDLTPKKEIQIQHLQDENQRLRNYLSELREEIKKSGQTISVKPKHLGNFAGYWPGVDKLFKPFGDEYRMPIAKWSLWRHEFLREDEEEYGWKNIFERYILFDPLSYTLYDEKKWSNEIYFPAFSENDDFVDLLEKAGVDFEGDSKYIYLTEVGVKNFFEPLQQSLIYNQKPRIRKDVYFPDNRGINKGSYRQLKTLNGKLYDIPESIDRSTIEMGKQEYSKEDEQRNLKVTSTKMPSFAIHRIVTRNTLSPSVGKRMEFASYCIRTACANIDEKVNVIQTPGGFLFFRINFGSILTGKFSKISAFNEIINRCAVAIEKLLTSELKRLLREKTNNLTLGVDVFDIGSDDIEKTQKRHAELVGTYSVTEEAFTGWTGKSTPVQEQTNTLLYCLDYDSHFQMIDDFSVVVLGCHDLNIFSPRSRKSSKPTSYKGKLMNEMQKRCDAIKPSVLLQHPHSTDSSKIWSVAWSGIKRFVPSVKIYSGGIHYANFKGGKQREPLEKVLKSTASESVQNTII